MVGEALVGWRWTWNHGKDSISKARWENIKGKGLAEVERPCAPRLMSGNG